MITTVTLNVAVDKAYVIEKLEKGSVLRVQACTNTAGGKGLNVTKVAHLCGEDIQACGFVGGHTGIYVEEMLKKEGIKCRFIHTEKETRSCINILESDGTSTELLEPGEKINDTELKLFEKEFDEVIEESDLISISGSVPNGIPTDIYAELVRKIKKANKKVIVDTSGKLLKAVIEEAPTLIKPNQDEMEELLGIQIHDHMELLEGARRLYEKGIPIVVVSMGGDGALVVCDEGYYVARPPVIEAVNTVGCGDSMTAAFAVGLVRNWSIEETLKYAVAVSSANAMTMPTGYFKQEDMERNRNQIKIYKNLATF